jgi:DNA end-binding protein Ku
MAAHARGSATISFGLVAIPVKLFSSGKSSESISFRMVHNKCGTPLKQQYVCPKDNEIVPRDDIAKGYEFVKDQYILFTPDEVKAVEEDPTHAITITEFIPMDKVDPVYFDKPYYLGPDKGAERAYRLLGAAMKKTGVVGIAQYAARGKNYLVMLRAIEGGLVMQQLRYAHEVRPFSEIDIPDAPDLKPQELALALQLMEQNVAKEFKPESYSDSSRERMLAMIQKKVDGQDILALASEAPQAQIIDLMDALKQSLGDKPAKGARKASAERKPAKRSPRVAESKTANGKRRKASR